MALRLVQVNVKARDDAALGRFWAEALGWDMSSEAPGVTNLEPEGFAWPDPDAFYVDLVTVPDPETVKYRVHLDLATTSAAHQAELVARVRRHTRECKPRVYELRTAGGLANPTSTHRPNWSP